MIIPASEDRIGRPFEDHEDYCRVGNCCCRCIRANRHTYLLGIDPDKLRSLWDAIEEKDVEKICLRYEEAKTGSE